MSKKIGQSKDEVPLMNVSFSAREKKEVVSEDKKVSLKKISLCISSAILLLIVSLSVTLLCYALINGRKNTANYLSSNGFGSFGIVSFVFLILSIIMFFIIKFVSNYILYKNEKLKKVCSFAKILSLYLMFFFLALTFFSVPLRQSVLTKIKYPFSVSVFILTATSVIISVLTALNALCIFKFTKYEEKMKMINIISLLILAFLPSISYSALESHYAFSRQAFIVIIYPIIFSLSLITLLKKNEEDKIDYLSIIFDSLVFVSFNIISYVIYTNGLLNPYSFSF